MSNGGGGESLRFSRAAGRAERGPDCPEEQRLRLLALGLADPTESQQLLAHCASCDCCGPVLLEARRRSFGGASDGSAPRLRKWLRRPIVVWIALATALAALMTVAVPRLVGHYSSLAVAQRATNRALGVAQTLPLRFPGVAYAKVTVERSVPGSRLSRPAEVLDAEARVKHGVDAHPDDPQWLQLEGRLNLVEDDEDAAIAELERASGLRVGDPYILSDLGAAYYRKAEKTDDPQFFAQAFESFSKGLKLKANDPALLFNLARGAQRIMAPHAEQDAWVAYLRADPGSGWDQEARAELDKVRAKLERQRAYSAATTPEALVAELRRGGPWEQLFAPDEEYLGVAVKRLLPAYYATPPDEGAGRTLHRMADEFVARHQDTWLRDVLKTSHTAQAGEGFAALGRAAEADDREIQQAEQANRLFRSAGGQAGALLAAFEQVQALAGLAKPCKAASQTLVSHLAGKDYFWLRTRASIVATLCQVWDMDFERAWSTRNATMDLAKQHGYRALWLRTLGLRASWDTRIGNISAAWRQYMRGLELYWTSNYPLLRAQLLYSELVLLAPQTHTVYSTVAWARESLETTSRLGIRDYHAAALYHLALAETSAGMPDSAEQHFQEYARYEPILPPEQRQEQELYMGMPRAEAETKLGLLTLACARLGSLQELVNRTGNASVQLRFNADLGQVRLRMGDYSTSARLLNKALAVGDGARAELSEDDSESWTRLMGETYRALVECDIRQGATPRQSWEKWSSYRAALSSQEAPNRDGEPTTGEDAMLSLAQLPSGIGLWLATPRGFHFQWVARAAGDAAARLVRNCATARSPLPVVRADARDVSRWLLGPWERELRGVSALVIESDGPLSSLPWDALVLSNGHYWSEEFATRIRVGACAARQPRTPVALAKSILAVGAPAVEGNQDLPPLADALEEAKKVSSLFPRSVLLGGRQATLMELRNRIKEAEIFHFAGHGYGGDGGGLILRGPGGTPTLLKAADIRNLDLSRCRLAVLSACSTGAGERNGPGDPKSLVRAFLRAKTGEVVAGFWNLNSSATQLLIDQFYFAMLSGVPTEQCLRAAAAAVRSRPEYQHPYYWAGLEVFSLH